MAGAYATFAASGEQRDPYSVSESSKDGTTSTSTRSKPKQRLHRRVADNVTDVLKTVVEKGTGYERPAARAVQVAGKTGTTDGNKSAWFVGYTPQLSTAIGMFRHGRRREEARTASSWRCTARVARRRSTVPRSRPRSGTTT